MYTILNNVDVPDHMGICTPPLQVSKGSVCLNDSLLFFEVAAFSIKVHDCGTPAAVAYL